MEIDPDSVDVTMRKQVSSEDPDIDMSRITRI